VPVAEPVIKIEELAKAAGVLRPRDLGAHGISRQYLRLAEQQGLVIRSGRGLYTLADVPITEFHTFAEAAKRSPRGVICLLSALRFHDIGTQSPFEVWMAIGEKDRRPVSDNPLLHIVRFSKRSLDFGQTTHNVEGVPLRVSSAALDTLYERAKRFVLGSKVLQADDTPVKVLDPSLPKTRTGRIWPYVGDAAHQAVVYDYTPTAGTRRTGEVSERYREYPQAGADGRGASMIARLYGVEKLAS
jgi:hypothetical protein